MSYTLTANYGLYKPTPNSDNDAWGGHLNTNADTLDALLGTGVGGTFLPLSGGTVTGAASFANVTYNMLSSGAVGNGMTDDTSQMQTFLNALPYGAEVILPAAHQFLVDSADLTLPAGITIRGHGALEAITLAGPAFILNPSYRIVVQSGTRLSNFKILRKGLLTSPTTAQANTAVAAWAAEAPLLKTSASTASGNTLPFTNTTGITVGMRAFGNEIGAYNQTVTAVVANTSVTFSQVVGPYPIAKGSYVRFGNSAALHLMPNSGGINLDRLFMMGFNTGILSECGRIFIDSVESDCTIAMYVTKAGDSNYAYRFHCIPYYGGDWNKRPGPGFLLTRADGILLDACTVAGWANGFVLSNTGGATLRRCWAESIYDGTTVTTGFKTEIAVGNQATFLGCQAGGSAAFDFQHQGGFVKAIGCDTALGAGDATSIAHYRLGPSSFGQITAAQIIPGSVMPFVVQSGVGRWVIASPQVFAPPNPWITGAAPDLANISIFGAPQANGAINTMAINASAGLALQAGGGAATFGGALIANGGIAFSGNATGTSGPGSIHSDANWGCLIRGNSGAVADVALQDSAGNAPLRVINNAVALSGTVGFNGSGPIAKPTVIGAKGSNAALASLMTALAAYGLVTDSTTA